MSADPREILERLHDPEFLREFIAASKTAVTAEMNQTRVASEVLLARAIADAMTRHASALQDAATASDKHGRSLTRATWALVLATVALVFATVAQWWR
jgi:hypothetical protein